MSDWVVDLRVRIDQTPRWREIELSHAEARELADLIAAHEAMNEWQPIETAPKDGSDLLLFVRTRHGRRETAVLPGFWMGPFWVTFNHDGAISNSADPTHWMPLPEPPK